MPGSNPNEYIQVAVDKCRAQGLNVWWKTDTDTGEAVFGVDTDPKEVLRLPLTDKEEKHRTTSHVLSRLLKAILGDSQ